MVDLLKLEGDPWTVGYAHGQAVGQFLHEALRTYVRGFVDAGMANPDDMRSRRESWIASLPVRYRQEMEGVAKGAAVPIEALVDSVLAGAYPTAGCSSILYYRDPHWWVAHNNDWYDFGSHTWTGAVVRAVEGRIPHLAFGLEGDVCTVVGVNRERLWLHMNGFPPRDTRPAGEKPVLPYVFVIRELLEVCGSLDDVEVLLERFDRDNGMAIYAVDGKTEEAALFECDFSSAVRREPDPRRTVVSHSRDRGDRMRHGAPGAVVGSNSTDRIDRIEERLSSADGEPLPEGLIRILSDARVEERGAEGLFQDPDSSTLYANVAAPGKGMIWFAHGDLPAASAGNWTVVKWPWNP